MRSGRTPVPGTPRHFFVSASFPHAHTPFTPALSLCFFSLARDTRLPFFCPSALPDDLGATPPASPPPPPLSQTDRFRHPPILPPRDLAHLPFPPRTDARTKNIRSKSNRQQTPLLFFARRPAPRPAARIPPPLFSRLGRQSPPLQIDSHHSPDILLCKKRQQHTRSFFETKGVQWGENSRLSRRPGSGRARKRAAERRPLFSFASSSAKTSFERALLTGQGSTDDHIRSSSDLLRPPQPRKRRGRRASGPDLLFVFFSAQAATRRDAKRRRRKPPSSTILHAAASLALHKPRPVPHTTHITFFT
jgi:hypothetical protein